MTSLPGESERDFRVRLQHLARERRDFELERLRRRYGSKTNTLRQRLMRAQQRIDREQESYSQQKVQTAVSVGATLLSALMGRKPVSVGTLGRASSAARQASASPGTSRTFCGLRRKRRRRAELSDLDQQLSREADQVAQAYDPLSETLQQIVIRPTKSDICCRSSGSYGYRIPIPDCGFPIAGQGHSLDVQARIRQQPDPGRATRSVGPRSGGDGVPPDLYPHCPSLQFVKIRAIVVRIGPRHGTAV